jgi:hypothetical protein
MNERKEGRWILVMALLFAGASLYLLALGSMDLGILTNTLLKKAMVINSFGTYQLQYSYFLVGSGGLAFIAFLTGTRHYGTSFIGIAWGALVLGALLMLLGIYAGYLMSIAGGLSFGLAAGSLAARPISNGGRTLRIRNP